MKTSDYLKIGDIYSRKQLAEMFQIKDATIYTGIFRPKGHNSVWLFITENKTPDRIQYSDYLDNDTLKWDGQMSGRKDRLIIDNKRLDIELLVFYRKRKDYYPDFGFRYEGPFEYESHTDSNPTHFILYRAGILN